MCLSHFSCLLEAPYIDVDVCMRCAHFTHLSPHVACIGLVMLPVLSEAPHDMPQQAAAAPARNCCYLADSKKIPADPSLELSCEAAIRPSFCWNSHQDTWQTGGVWSQFETGLKSCQDDVSACVNFMGDKDAALAGLLAILTGQLLSFMSCVSSSCVCMT